MKIILFVAFVFLGFMTWCLCAAASDADRRSHRPTLYCLVGLPGSGKSTYCKYRGYVVSSDRIREEMYGDAAVQHRPDLVFEEMLKRTKLGLDEHIDVYYDATNLKKKFRQQLIENTPYVRHVCLIMNTPLDVCVSRDAERERSVGEDVIYKMWNSYEVPTIEEGWDSIKYID